MQIPIGLEEKHDGVVDLVNMKAVTFHGQHGNEIKVSDEIPSELQDLANEKRKELIETVSGVDDDLAEIFLMEEEPTVEQLKEAIRRSVVSNQFSPVFMGSAYKNRGVQLLLDGVVDYLGATRGRKRCFGFD